MKTMSHFYSTLSWQFFLLCPCALLVHIHTPGVLCQRRLRLIHLGGQIKMWAWLLCFCVACALCIGNLFFNSIKVFFVYLVTSLFTISRSLLLYVSCWCEHIFVFISFRLLGAALAKIKIKCLWCVVWRDEYRMAKSHLCLVRGESVVVRVDCRT